MSTRPIQTTTTTIIIQRMNECTESHLTKIQCKAAPQAAVGADEEEAEAKMGKKQIRIINAKERFRCVGHVDGGASCCFVRRRYVWSLEKSIKWQRETAAHSPAYLVQHTNSFLL